MSLSLINAEGPNKFVILTTPKHDVKKLQIGFEGKLKFAS